MIYIFAKNLRSATSYAFYNEMPADTFTPLTNERHFARLPLKPKDKLVVLYYPLYVEFLARGNGKAKVELLKLDVIFMETEAE